MQAEHQEILAMVEKYKTYFDLWDADVAIGLTGKNIFYVLEDQEVNLFASFRTAEELEKLILGTIARDATVLMETAANNLSLRFYDACEQFRGPDPESASQDVTGYLELLRKDLAIIREELQNWEGVIKRIVEPLKAVGGIPEDPSRQKGSAQ